MALSGTINGSTNNQYIDSKIEWSATQNVAGNYSTVIASLYYRRNNTGFTTEGTGNFTLTINGTSQTAYSKHLVINTGWVLAVTASVLVNHNADGTKTIAIDATGSLPGTSLANTYCSASVSLNTIPRASSFTLNKSSFTAGESVTVSISRASSSFTHKIYYSHNNSTWTLVDAGSATSKSITFATSYCSNYPNSMSGTIWFYINTYNGSTLIGTSGKKTVTFNVPSYTPALTSISAVRVDGTVPGGWGIYVKDKSKAKVTFTGASTSYGASIASYVVNGAAFTSNPATTGAIGSSGTVTLSGYIVDSRGRQSAAKSTAITVYDYYNPSILSLEINRCNANGTMNEDGTYISCKADFTYANCNGKNSVNCRVSYRLAGTTNNYSTPVAMQNRVAAVLGGGTILTNREYDVKVEIYDAFSSAAPFTVTRVVPISARILNILPSGKGIALGRVAAVENCLDARDWQGRFSNLVVGGNTVADYIVSQGTSGNWVYRKWNSGFLECYYKHTSTNISFSNSAQSGTNALAMPSVLLTKYTYLLQASLTAWTSYSICWSDATNSEIVYAVRTTDGHIMNGLNQIRIIAEVKGTWK